MKDKFKIPELEIILFESELDTDPIIVSSSDGGVGDEDDLLDQFVLNITVKMGLVTPSFL